MKRLILAALAVAVTACAANADELIYGYDDAGLDGWYVRADGVLAEQPPELGTNMPSQGGGYVSMGVESNRYYTLIRTQEGFQSTVLWEAFDRIAFDVRLSNPLGWNHFALLCRSSSNWNYSVASSQIYSASSDTWVTIRGPITAELTNYLYSSAWVYFEFAFLQSETNTTRIDIDNFRLESDTNLLDAGILLYGFNTNTLDGWAGTKRGALTMDETTKVEGTASLRLDITNAIGNWANPGFRNPAIGDAPWELNSNLVAWIRASDTVWSNSLRPYLVFGLTYASTSFAYEINADGGDGHITLDDQWHPYSFAYDPAWLSNATALNLSFQVTTVGSPIGKYYHIDDVRLLPGIVPEPVAAAVLALGSLVALRRRR